MIKQKPDKQKKNSLLSNLLFLMIFLSGLGILIYPMISAVYYDYQASTDINDFNKEVKLLSEKELDKRIEQAKAYNQSLTHTTQVLHDSYTEKEEENGKKAYARMLEVNEKIGHVEIPKIHQDLPIFAGTTEHVLQKGVGHLENTSLPVGGLSTRAVLSAHRGLPDKKLFTDLDKMKKGDMIYVHNIRDVLAYKVDKIEVIKPEEFDKIKIQEGKDLVTLLTCTPYMINSHRMLVTGHRVPYTPELQKQHQAEKDPWWYKFITVYKNYLIGLAIAFVLFLLWRIWQNKKRKREAV